MSAPDFTRIRDFTVGTQRFTGAYLQACVAFSGDLQRDLQESYAWIAYWGAVAADAKQLYDAKQAAYRTARDRYILDKSKEKTVSKTAANELWRTEKTYLEWQAKTSEAERAWNIASAIHEACDRKSNLLQSQVKLYLADTNAQGRSPLPGDPR